MATWTLLLMNSPLNTVGGSTGMIGELTEASGRKLNFNTEDVDILDFSMPGNSLQTSQIEPLVSDVLAFRDDYAVQRFRVVSRTLSKSDGVLSASFACVSYRGLLNAWMMRDTDQRSFPSAAQIAAAVTSIEQTTIAWTAFNTAHSRPNSTLGVTRGPSPTISVNRDLRKPDADFQAVEYFDVGQPIGDVIDSIALMDNGFEWDIIPDPASPYTALKFMHWTAGDGWRNQFKATATGRSTMILDDGGNVASWEHTTTPTDYGNVIRLTGAEDSGDNFTAGAGTPVWVPTDKGTTTYAALPARWPAKPPEGRWERNVTRDDLKTDAAVAAAASAEYDKVHLYVPAIDVDLTRGRWEGPTQLWIGDKARLIISELVTGTADSYILYVDEDVRVVEFDVTVDDLGAEDVSLSLNRPAFTSVKNTRGVYDRLRRLERK